MRAVKYVLLTAFVLGAFAFVAGAFSYFFGTPTGRTAIVTITDASPAAVAALLREKNVLDAWSVQVFRVVARGEIGRGLHAGTFAVSQGEPLRRLLRDLAVQGRQEVTVTVPEGSDLRDLAAILMKAGIVKTPEELYAVTGKPAYGSIGGDVGEYPYRAEVHPSVSGSEYPFLAEDPTGISLEGYLFPDTYRVYADASPMEVVKKMVVAFESRTKDLRTKPVPAGLSNFHDVLTLASIVEAEVRSDKDRRLVADIFLRRLAAGMAFQADSTVHYATGVSGTVFTSDADRAVASPWNTYKVRGLPPGPIANPGRQAIEAVLDPTPNAYVYFLTGTDGAVYYARTLEEQTANKKYLK